jgi:hypothetical protein
MINGIKVVDKLSICTFGSVHFWHRIHPKKKINKTTDLARIMVQSFHEVRVRGLYGNILLSYVRERRSVLLTDFRDETPDDPSVPQSRLEPILHDWPGAQNRSKAKNYIF